MPSELNLTLSILMATAAGLVGCFALMKKMTLASDAMSHIALPGLGIAIAFGISPLLGGAVAVLIGALIIWELERQTKISTETMIGVVFSFALAVGSLLSTDEELIDALFGGGSILSPAQTSIGILAALLVIAFLLTARHRLVVSLVSPDIARTVGIHVPRLNLAFLFAFAVTIILGLHYLGVLLMGSLIIIPAATARRLARTFPQMLIASVFIAVFSTLIGIYLSVATGYESGPLIVVAATIFFLVSLLFRSE